jgi:hypothetical protein
MTTIKAKAGYLSVGALLTVFALWPMLKETNREQRWGLLLSPEEVKATCGRPQADDIFKLTYVEGDRRVELQFFGANHRMFLQHVKWSSSKGGGEINKVSRDAISDYVKRGWLPSCLEVVAQ